MAKATIKTKSGAQITVEGTEAEVASIVASFEHTSSVTRAKAKVSRDRAQAKEGKKRLAASDLIIQLKEEGFFEKPKTLGDVSTALEEQGYLYPTTSLSGVVLGLVQKRVLRRKKADGKWVYGK